VAVSVTIVPFVNAAVQVAPQSIPLGELVTVPEPEPNFVTVREQHTPGRLAGAKVVPSHWPTSAVSRS
jgi:hypothetical protein